MALKLHRFLLGLAAPIALINAIGARVHCLPYQGTPVRKAAVKTLLEWPRTPLPKPWAKSAESQLLARWTTRSDGAFKGRTKRIKRTWRPRSSSLRWQGVRAEQILPTQFNEIDHQCRTAFMTVDCPNVWYFGAIAEPNNLGMHLCGCFTTHAQSGIVRSPCLCHCKAPLLSSSYVVGCNHE